MYGISLHCLVHEFILCSEKTKGKKKKFIFMHCRSCYCLVQWSRLRTQVAACKLGCFAQICGLLFVYIVYVFGPHSTLSRQAYRVRLYISCFSCTTARSIPFWHRPTIMCFMFSSYYKCDITKY